MPTDRPLIPFPWSGGKSYILDFIIPLMPPSEVSHFVDVFGGAAQVVLNAPKYRVRTYNDLDGELVNFFRCLRDRTEELVGKLTHTLYSREEFWIAIDRTDEHLLDDVDWHLPD